MKRRVGFGDVEMSRLAPKMHPLIFLVCIVSMLIVFRLLAEPIPLGQKLLISFFALLLMFAALMFESYRQSDRKI
ncbi:MAG: hypothetical protein ACLFU9_07090 [Candidatus Bathyarchaeia archaeon]